MEISELRARLRKDSGKGTARRLRQKGLVPAIVYGSKSKPVLLEVSSSELVKILRGKEENVFINLHIENGKKIEKFTLIKELQIEPVSKKFYHVDFCEIDRDQAITLDVPIHFKGVAKGVDDGGDLHHMKREIKVSCLFSMLPDFIEVDISNLSIGDSIKVQDITLPEGITLIDPEDTILASVTAPKTTEKVEEIEEQEPVEIKEEQAAE